MNMYEIRHLTGISPIAILFVKDRKDEAIEFHLNHENLKDSRTVMVMASSEEAIGAYHGKNVAQYDSSCNVVFTDITGHETKGHLFFAGNEFTMTFTKDGEEKKYHHRDEDPTKADWKKLAEAELIFALRFIKDAIEGKPEDVKGAKLPLNQNKLLTKAAFIPTRNS